jgi:hypothetical protein
VRPRRILRLPLQPRYQRIATGAVGAA